MEALAQLEDLAKQRWQNIAALVAEGEADPIRATDVLRQIKSEMLMLQSLGYPVNPRAGASRILRADPLPSLAANGGEADELPSLRFARAGIVLAMYGNVLPVTGVTAEDAMRSISVNVRWRAGDRSLGSNGQGPALLQYAALFTPQSPWFPLSLLVRGSDTTWNLTVRNDHPTEALTPTLYFSFLPLPPNIVEKLAVMWGDG